MRKKIVILFALYLFIFYSNKVFGQSNNDSLINRSTTLEFKNDTLFTDTGLKFFVGQKLIIGNPAGNDGYYRSIIDKRAALVPSIWGQDPRYPYAIENHVNKKKSREKVKKNLIPGNSVSIKGIGYSKTGKPYFYAASISTGSEDFLCDLKFALLLNELILKP